MSLAPAGSVWVNPSFPTDYGPGHKFFGHPKDKRTEPGSDSRRKHAGDSY